MKRKLIGAGMAMVLVFGLAACADSDIVGKESINSFAAVLETVPDSVGEDDMYGGWALASPDGSERFIWSKDYSAGTPHDVMIEFDLKPFLDAGLDVTKLPAGMVVEDKIMVGTALGDEELTYDGDATPLASYEKIVELKRESVKYHEDLDHYGVDLGNGNAFEWAKDVTTNDKDIVFVVDPQVFIEAGVAVDQVEGWVFAKVNVMDEDGEKIQVDKLLKPFDLI